MFRAEIEGLSEINGVTFYHVRVSGPHGESYVARRYSDFHALYQAVQRRFPSLPPMPAKVVLPWTARRLSGDRCCGLEALLEALVAADPKLSDPDLEAFLEVDAAEAERIACLAARISTLSVGSAEMQTLVCLRQDECSRLQAAVHGLDSASRRCDVLGASRCLAAAAATTCGCLTWLLAERSARLGSRAARAEADVEPLQSQFRDVVNRDAEQPGGQLTRRVAAVECAPLLEDLSSETREQLKRRLLSKWHPDKQPTTSHSKFAKNVTRELEARRGWQR